MQEEISHTWRALCFDVKVDVPDRDQRGRDIGGATDDSDDANVVVHEDVTAVTLANSIKLGETRSENVFGTTRLLWPDHYALRPVRSD